MDDHDITSKDCLVKQKAIKAHCQHKHRQRSVTQKERDADIPTSNRFELLSPSEEDTPALVEPDNACYEAPTYSDAVKRGEKRVQQAASTPKLSVTKTDDQVKLDQQTVQLQIEVKRLAQRRTYLARPAGSTAMRGTHVPYAASVPESSSASVSAPVKMAPAELLHFVARQLQELLKFTCIRSVAVLLVCVWGGWLAYPHLPWMPSASCGETSMHLISRGATLLPAAVELRDKLNKLTPAERHCEKRLALERWMDWCASLVPSSSSASIWRMKTMISMGERSGAWN
ncbi:hypothetical protein HPB51_019484 [Rhipicephalus microplus]|uniref:Uncharacterized protein n=1 Tax=Rhipicephalus microplus TaxID=6941 RepID=A0A9J6DCA9_RHIMP|nr:hypothetical protein HPB51_019484 [Rhipicephalus microplus]